MDAENNRKRKNRNDRDRRKEKGLGVLELMTRSRVINTEENYESDMKSRGISIKHKLDPLENTRICQDQLCSGKRIDKREPETTIYCTSCQRMNEIIDRDRRSRQE